MKITFVPLDAKDPQFGPFENVEYAHFVNHLSAGAGRLMVPDHTLYMKNGVQGIILPENAIYAIRVEKE
jgi:hypothetical protein